MYFITAPDEHPVQVEVEVVAVFEQYVKVRSDQHGQFFLFVPLFFCCDVTGFPELGDPLRVKFHQSNREVIEARFF